MELNITFTELALLCWAILATAAAFKYMDEARIAKKMLIIFINDEDARNQILQAHERFVKVRDELRSRQ